MRKHNFILLLFLGVNVFAQKSDLDENSAKNYIQLSKKYAPIQFDSAYYYAEKAIDWATQNKNEEILALAYGAKGLAFDYQSLIDSTLFWYNKALNIRLKQKNNKELVKLYNNFGVTYYYQGMYDQALTYYIKSLKQSETIKDSVGIARSFNNIGLIFDKKKDYIRATEYYEKSLEIKRLLKDDKGLLFPLSNLSNIAYLQKDYNSAENYMLLNLQVSKKIADSVQIGISHASLAVIYASQGNKWKSLENIHLAEKFTPIIHDEFEASLFYYNLGESYFQIGDDLNAEKKLYKSIEISRKIKQTDNIVKSYHILQKIKYRQGKLEESLKYYDLYTSLNDSIFKVNQAVKIAEIEQQYMWEKKEKEIELLNLKVAKETSQKRNWILGFGFLGILGAIVSGFFLLNRKKSIQLAQKNKVIESALTENKILMKEMNHRIKNNLQMVSSLLHLQTRHIKNKESLNTLKETAYRINSISIIHQKLYAKDGIQQINIKPYIQEIAEEITHNFSHEKQVELFFHLQDVILEIEKAQSIGLIVNELILNALKHAKPISQLLKIEISLYSVERKNILKVKDNGTGIKDSNVIIKPKTYGMQLIHSFVEKLDGKMSFDNNDGFLIEIAF